MAFTTTVIVISVLIAGMDFLIAKKSLEENKKEGYFLGCSCQLAAIVDISYLLSILVDNSLVYACLTSIYFISIDLMLNYDYSYYLIDSVILEFLPSFVLYLSLDLHILSSSSLMQ